MNRIVKQVASLVVFSVCLTWVDIASARCFVSVQDMVFGNYDASDLLPKTSTAKLTIDCRSPILVTVNMGASSISGSITNRQMQHEYKPDRLNYNLYNDPAMSAVWGDGTQAGGQVTRIDGLKTVTIYGKVFPGQNVWYGNYSDSITVTILP